MNNTTSRQALLSFFCAASLLAMAPMLNGCFGCGAYDGNGNHMDGDEDSDQNDQDDQVDQVDISRQVGQVEKINSMDAAPVVTACSCIQAYGSDSMDEAAIKKLVEEGLPACFSADPAELETQASCLPSVVGKAASNGLDLQIYYYCSDICPDYGHIGVAYAGVADVAECCKLGGEPVMDPAWGGFEGCAPAGLGTGNPGACGN